MAISRGLAMLADLDLYVNIGFVVGGYLAASTAGNLYEGVGPDLDDEVFGMLSMVVSAYVDRPFMAAGGAVFALKAVGDRTLMKERAENAGSDSGGA